jgi:hypothetical protein
MEGTMTRGLMIGAFCAVFALAMSLGSDSAFAAGKKQRGPSGPAPCITYPAPLCPPFFIPICVKRNACGGCVSWSCRPIFFPPFWFVS